MERAVYYDRKQPGYPPRLLELERVPAGLYVIGTLPEPSDKSVAIVGARSCSDYGRKEAVRFARELAKHGVQIISGLAYGIDAWAHWGALEGGGRTFAVPVQIIRFTGGLSGKEEGFCQNLLPVLRRQPGISLCGTG